MPTVIYEDTLNHRFALFDTWPMALYLYNYYEENNINNIFRWAPDQNQWWITGFKPDFTTPDQSKMAIAGSVDFSENAEMYRTFKEYVHSKMKLMDYVVFDDVKHTVWIMWWGENANEENLSYFIDGDSNFINLYGLQYWCNIE